MHIFANTESTIIFYFVLLNILFCQKNEAERCFIVVKSTHCSWRGPQIPNTNHGYLTNVCKSHSRGSESSSSLHGHLHVHGASTHTKEHTHKQTNKDKKLNTVIKKIEKECS